MIHTIPRQLIADALEAADLYEAAENLNATYVGRSMGGTPCVNFVLDGKRGAMRKLMQFAFNLGMNVADPDTDADQEQSFEIEALITDLLNRLSMDDLGMDMIVYFPGWTLS